MEKPLDTGALLSRTYELPTGPRVVLRYARRTDLPGLRGLLVQRGIDPTDLELGRLIRYDPARRAVIAAIAPPTLVGVGAIDLTADAEPDTIVVDERVADGLPELLVGALRGRARAHARRVA